MVSEQEAQQLIAKHNAYKSHAESISQQIQSLQMSILDCDRAIQTLDGIAGGPKDTMIPIGSGSFVYATITEPDKVVVGVGAGISAEKSTEDAKDILSSRKDNIMKVVEQLNGTLADVSKELQNIQAIMSQHAPVAQ